MDFRLPLGKFADITRRADPSDDVLALSVGKEVADGIGLPVSSSRLNATAGATRVAPISEHHLLDGHRGSPLIWDTVDAPVAIARSLLQDSNTAAIALRSCSHGSSGSADRPSKSATSCCSVERCRARHRVGVHASPFAAAIRLRSDPRAPRQPPCRTSAGVADTSPRQTARPQLPWPSRRLLGH